MNLFHSLADIECFVIIVVLSILFFASIRTKTTEVAIENKGFMLDTNFSGALKGIACILILMGHYAQMFYYKTDGCFNWYVARISANVALVWFMFISGYGLTKSKRNLSKHFAACVRRCSKVLFPMLFAWVISFMVYLILPSWHDGVDVAHSLAIPDEMLMLHNLSDFEWGSILFSPVKWYWYVWCITVYYILYYLSDYFTQRCRWNQTYILGCLLMAYYFAAFFLLGPSLAHYYRLTWAFYLGHLLAVYREITPPQNWGG